MIAAGLTLLGVLIAQAVTIWLALRSQRENERQKWDNLKISTYAEAMGLLTKIWSVTDVESESRLVELIGEIEIIGSHETSDAMQSLVETIVAEQEAKKSGKSAIEIQPLTLASNDSREVVRNLIRAEVRIVSRPTVTLPLASRRSFAFSALRVMVRWKG